MDNLYVVTISHLLGCGGAEIGKELSEALSIPFVDRQILKETADCLNVPEGEIEDREERLVSFWQAFSRVESLGDPLTAAGAEYLPSDRELYTLESEYIVQIAKKSSCIILGRGGRYILRDFPRHLSVFVTADKPDRIKRVAALYGVSDGVAARLIEKNDRERSAYLKTFTHFEWLDVRNYDICLNTSSVGVKNAVKLIKDVLGCKFK